MIRIRRSEDEPVAVWDLPVRLCHWVSALLVAGCYVTWQRNWMGWHVRLGETLLALVIFRLSWAVWGSENARFRAFLAPPGAVFRHLATIFRREPDHAAGHNPAGGWMVLALLALLLGETLSGIYVNNDIANESALTELVPAPIANAIDDLHFWLWWALAAAVAVHVLAIAVYALAKGQNLVRPMLTGVKTLPPAIPRPRFAPRQRALWLLALSVAATLTLAWGL